MWPRISEIILGIWLLASVFVFEGSGFAIFNRVACGIIIILLSAGSWSWRFRRAYLLNIAVGLWLAGFAWITAGHPARPALQSDLLTALLLLCFAILPNEASKPPASWSKILPGM